MIEGAGFWIHRYSVFKSLSTNGYHMSRIFRLAGLSYIPFVLLALTILPFALLNRKIQHVEYLFFNSVEETCNGFLEGQFTKDYQITL